MSPLAAKLPSSDIACPGTDDRVADAQRAAAPALPTVLFASLALHGLIAAALVGLPLTASVSRELEATWVSFDLETPPPAAAPEVEAPAPAIETPTPPEQPVVRRERPQPVAAPEPEVTPTPPATEELAPPSIDDVFGEPPPPAPSLVGEGTGGFAVAPGEPGGVAGGTPGGHGTSLVSAVRPGVTSAGPSEADRRRARRGYVHTIEELVRAHTRYPRAASRDGLQGRVELALRIGADGHVLAIRIATTSGHGILDEAALDAAREIDRVPAPPLVAALTSGDEVRVGVVYLVR